MPTEPAENLHLLDYAAQHPTNWVKASRPWLGCAIGLSLGSLIILGIWARIELTHFQKIEGTQLLSYLPREAYYQRWSGDAQWDFALIVQGVLAVITPIKVHKARWNPRWTWTLLLLYSFSAVLACAWFWCFSTEAFP
jgi:hypothetical protein